MLYLYNNTETAFFTGLIFATAFKYCYLAKILCHTHKKKKKKAFHLKVLVCAISQMIFRTPTLILAFKERSDFRAN